MKKLPLLLVLFLLIPLTWQSARNGYASLLASKVASPNDLPAVTTAAQLSPGNPLAQVLLGALLEANQDRAAALTHYQTAVALRPDDYLLRLQLARGQELAGDTAAAINSATVAVTLAPFYAQPHWQLGNILVRAGRVDEGFKELRRAADGDPRLLPSVVDLAGQISGGDFQFLKRLLIADARTTETYLALADYLLKRGAVAEAVATLLDAGHADNAITARRKHVGDLINAKNFPAAYKLWAFDHALDSAQPTGMIVDFGFEAEIDLEEPGFGWRAPSGDDGLTLSRDSANPKSGGASLRVDFNGAVNASTAVVSQLVLVEPKTAYRLSFAVRTENLVSGGLPLLTIVDASSNQLLGQTDALPPTTSGWQDQTIDFTTGAAATAIRISLGRRPCPTAQCPIFGKLWLDEFRITGK